MAEGVAREAADGSSASRQVIDGEAGDLAGAGAGGVDTPFETPLGRLPGETLAPLALGLGVALAITDVVFGPWLLVAGLVPMAWGGWTWYTAARDELRATASHEAADPVAAPVTGRRGASSTPRDAADSTSDVA